MLRAGAADVAGRLGRLLDRLARRLAAPPPARRRRGRGRPGLGRARRALARAARSERGRWAGRVAVLAAAAAVLVVVLYGHGELPRAAARPAPVAGRTSGGRVGERPPARPARPRPAPSTPASAARPAEVAAAWYAGVHHLRPGSVRALQQDRRSATEVRVLVLAKGPGGRLDTALVRVRRGPRGWAVPAGGAPATAPGRAARPLVAGGGPR